MSANEPRNHFYKSNQGKGYLVFTTDDNPFVRVEFSQSISLQVYLDSDSRPAFVVQNAAATANILCEKDIGETKPSTSDGFLKDSYSKGKSDSHSLDKTGHASTEDKSDAMVYNSEVGFNEEMCDNEMEEEETDFSIGNDGQSGNHRPPKHSGHMMNSELSTNLCDSDDGFSGGTLYGEHNDLPTVGVIDQGISSIRTQSSKRLSNFGKDKLNVSKSGSRKRKQPQPNHVESSSQEFSPYASPQSFGAYHLDYNEPNSFSDITKDTFSDHFQDNADSVVREGTSTELQSSRVFFQSDDKNIAIGTSHSSLDTSSNANPNVISFTTSQESNSRSSSEQGDKSSTPQGCGNHDVDGQGDKAPQKAENQAKFSCEYCHQTLHNYSNFVANQRAPPAVHKCPLCKLSLHLTTKAHLIVHLLRHKGLTNDDIIEITSMSYKEAFKKWGSGRNGFYILQREKQMENYSCPSCDFHVKTASGMWSHVLVHTVEFPYICCVCSFKCSTKHSLRRHLSFHKNNQKTIKCLTCEERFQSRADLAKHRLSHGYVCGFCGLKVARLSELRYHYQTRHGDEAIRCPRSTCPTLCFSQEDLENHLRKHAISAKARQCNVCGLVVSNLRQHMLVHDLDDSKKIHCEKCPMVFNQLINYKNHLLSHSKECFYDCDECLKKFKRPGQLRRHKLSVHEQLRPHVCDVCGKRCSTPYNLKVHKRIHLDVKVFPCDHCSQRFNYKSSLQQHMKSKHNITLPHVIAYPNKDDV